MAYYDEVANLMKDVTSPLEYPDEPEERGTDTLASAGAGSGLGAGAEQVVADPNADGGGGGGTAAGTGRYSPNGNTLPAGLYTRDNPSSLPDAQYAASQGAGRTARSPITLQPAGPRSSTPATIAVNGAPPDAGGGATAASSTVAPVDSAAPDYSPYATAGFQGQLANLQQGDQTTQQMEAQPTLAATVKPDQDIVDANSAPLSDKAKEYRPSVGERILRGVHGWARGGVLGIVNPQMVGGKAYGAGNADYDRDVATRAYKAQTAGQRIVQAQANYKVDQARLKQQADSEQAQSLGYSRLPTGAAGQQNAQSEKSNAAVNVLREKDEQTRIQQESPEAKAAAQQTAETLRTNQLNDPKSPYHLMPGWQRLQFISTGQVRAEKGRDATPEEVMFKRIYGAWQQDPANKGKRPSADDYAGMVAQSKGQETPTNKADEQNVRDQLKVGTDRVNAAKADLQLKQQALQKTYVPKEKAAAQAAVQQAQQEYDAATGAVNAFSANLANRGKVPAQTAAAGGPAAVARNGGAAAPTVKPTPQTHPVGTPITVNGQAMTITGYNPATGKAIVSPVGSR